MTPADQDHSLRLNRFLARCGYGSRRSVETLITAGRIAIDGEVVHDLGRRVDPLTDRVTVDGEVARLPGEFRIYAFHKPSGVVSTLRAQAGQVALDSFRAEADLPLRFVPVGRLDAATTGLLLWTDDGALAQALLRPAHKVWKRYEVAIDQQLVPSAQRRFADGIIELDGRPCLPCRLLPDDPLDGRHWVVELHEGRKRQVRRMFSEVGCRVLTLRRVAFGPVELGRLKAGGFRRLTPQEVAALRTAAGLPQR